MKDKAERKKYSSYCVRHVSLDTIVSCPRCKRAMKYIRCSPNTLLSSLAKQFGRVYVNTRMFDYVYKCQKCNLWQHHWAKEYRESLKPRPRKGR